MLKKFFLNVLSSFVGAWVAIVLLIIGATIFILGMIGSIASDDTTQIERHSIMKIVLGGDIDETDSEARFDYTVLFNGSIEKAQTLRTLVRALEKAKNNGDIEALFIECTGTTASPATLDALRNAIKDFKKSGKRVVAYGDILTMGDYYVSTVADAVYLNPAGSLDMQGIGGTSLYMKDLLDKVGIEVQAVRVGTYKSAIEPYTSNEMSAPAKMQLDTLYGKMWWYMLDGIAKDRKVSASAINQLVSDFVFLKEAEKVKDANLVDGCLYYREVLDELADYVGKDTEDLNFVSPELIVGNEPVNPDVDRQIAVVYAVGDIGEYEGAGIDCHQLVPIIVSLAEDDNIEGMVLRVNSPGGSVFGSEQIGEALDYFQSKGKPLAVSMGDYAASGGYWISACADRIFADPLTITGSIGIFGLVPNVGKLAAKIGVHPQTVATNPGVKFPSIFYPMTEEQEAALRVNIERGYEKFVTRVSKGRHLSVEDVKKIAEGRVWSALTAKNIGLVDQLGALQEAVDWVASKAGVSNPRVVAYPLPKNNFWDLIANTNMGKAAQVKAIVDRMKAKNIDEKMIDMAEWLLLQNHEQARAPYYRIQW